MFPQVLATEFLKLRRCKVTWASLAALSLGPLGIALFMWIVREPGRAGKLGLVGAKASLTGLEATWPAYAGGTVLIVGAGGMVLLSFVAAYVFGREYAEGTAKNMLALPVARWQFVVAKLVVIFVWWVLLAVAVVAEATVVGLALGLPGFSTGVLVSMFGRAVVAASISYLLTPVVAWATIAGRGYMAPIAFAIVMMGLGNLFGKTGWAPYFPWSVVPTLIGMVGTPAEGVPAASYAVLALTFAAGAAGAILQLRLADNTQ